MYTSIEICAGAGGQALGLHQAGFHHKLLIEIDENAAATLRYNSKQLNLQWEEIKTEDVKEFAKHDVQRYVNQIALFAGGVPCPPFSKAGNQLGSNDERDLFPTALKIVSKIKPKAVLLENVPGLAEGKFADYRKAIREELELQGYWIDMKILQASDFGVSQLRPRFIIVALRKDIAPYFTWPQKNPVPAKTVGELLYDLMSRNGWEGAAEWKKKANQIAPTLVGGSKKHGGPDLGPTRAKQTWQKLGVNAHLVAVEDQIPGPGFNGIKKRTGSYRPGTEKLPLLTTRMTARIQGFPDDWEFIGNKTNVYRQIGNAFPPPVAEAVGKEIFKALKLYSENTNRQLA